MILDTKRAIIYITVLTFSIGIIVGFSINASAQQSNTIPSWIKNTAKWWADGQVSDSEFIRALQWLIDQKILVVPQSTSTQPTSQQSTQVIPSTQGQQHNVQESFSGIVCSRDLVNPGQIVNIGGKFNNGPTSYSMIYLVTALEDSNGNIVATSNSVIDNIGPNESKIFSSHIIYSGDYAKCDVEIGNKYP